MRKRMLYLILVLILSGCGSSHLMAQEKEVYSDFSKMFKEYVKLEKIKQGIKYKETKNGSYWADAKDAMEYLRGIENEWNQAIPKLENFIQSNPSSRFSDDYEFFVVMFLSELDPIGNQYVDNVINRLDEILDKNSKLSIENEIKGILRKSKLLTSIVNSFETTRIKTNVEDYREYILDKIISIYIQKERILEAKKRLDKAKAEGFKSKFLTNLQDKITSIETVLKAKGTVPKEGIQLKANDKQEKQCQE